MSCDCEARMDSHLRPHNIRLAHAIQVTDKALIARLRIAVEPLSDAPRNAVKKAPVVVANYCPFCGKKREVE